MKPKIIVALLICYSTLVLNAQAAGSNINVVINGKNVDFNSNSGYPYIDENYRTMVPLRVTMEATGAAVGYDPTAQTAIHYIGDDLNTAIYPQEDGFTVLTPELSLTVTPDEPAVENPFPEYTYVEKEWLTKLDLQNADCAFRILVFDGTVYQKGFLKYQMDDLPDDFEENPVPGTYNGVRIKVENGEILFNQEDLISVGLITNPITELQ